VLESWFDTLIGTANFRHLYRFCDGNNVRELLERLHRRFTSTIRTGDHGCQNELLLYAIKKYIYGCTPMCEALSWSFNAFGETNDANTTQILVIVSDGQGTDGDPVRKMEELTAQRARHDHVWVVCCFIADPDISQGIPEVGTIQNELNDSSRHSTFRASSGREMDSSQLWSVLIVPSREQSRRP
jgi:hypothetical protein